MVKFERGHEVILEGSIEGVSFEIVYVCMIRMSCTLINGMVKRKVWCVLCIVCICGEGGGEEKKNLCQKDLCPKGNAFETTFTQTYVKHQGLFPEAFFNTFEIVTSHNSDVLTNNFCKCFTRRFVLSTIQ